MRLSFSKAINDITNHMKKKIPDDGLNFLQLLSEESELTQKESFFKKKIENIKSFTYNKNVHKDRLKTIIKDLQKQINEKKNSILALSLKEKAVSNYLGQKSFMESINSLTGDTTTVRNGRLKSLLLYHKVTYHQLKSQYSRLHNDVFCISKDDIDNSQCDESIDSIKEYIRSCYKPRDSIYKKSMHSIQSFLSNRNIWFNKNVNFRALEFEPIKRSKVSDIYSTNYDFSRTFKTMEGFLSKSDESLQDFYNKITKNKDDNISPEFLHLYSTKKIIDKARCHMEEFLSNTKPCINHKLSTLGDFSTNILSKGDHLLNITPLHEDVSTHEKIHRYCISPIHQRNIDALMDSNNSIFQDTINSIDSFVYDMSDMHNNEHTYSRIVEIGGASPDGSISVSDFNDIINDISSKQQVVFDEYTNMFDSTNISDDMEITIENVQSEETNQDILDMNISISGVSDTKFDFSDIMDQVKSKKYSFNIDLNEHDMFQEHKCIETNDYKDLYYELLDSDFTRQIQSVIDKSIKKNRSELEYIEVLDEVIGEIENLKNC